MSFWNHLDEVANVVGSAVGEFGGKTIVDTGKKLLDGEIGEAAETFATGTIIYDVKGLVRGALDSLISGDSNN